MAKASDNKFPQVILNASTGVAAASTGTSKLWLSTGAALTITSSSGGETEVGGGGATVSHTFGGNNSVGSTFIDPAVQAVYCQKLTVTSTAGSVVTSIDAFIHQSAAASGSFMVGIWSNNASTDPNEIIAISGGEPTNALRLDGASASPRWVAMPIGAHLSTGVYWVGWRWFDKGNMLLHRGTGGGTRIIGATTVAQDSGVPGVTTSTQNFSIRASMINLS